MTLLRYAGAAAVVAMIAAAPARAGYDQVPEPVFGLALAFALAGSGLAASSAPAAATTAPRPARPLRTDEDAAPPPGTGQPRDSASQPR